MHPFHLPRFLIRPLLFAAYGYHRLTGAYGFGPDQAEPAETPDPDRANPLKAALWRHHVKQAHFYSCSVASVANCVNALRTLRDALAPPLEQAELLARVPNPIWQERMGENGSRGRRGLPLALFGQVVRDSLDAFGFGDCAVETVQAGGASGNDRHFAETLRHRLLAFEHEGRGLLIAHFNQGMFVPALSIPHISPVGGFAEEAGRVTILDVDPEARPYHVSFDSFRRGMACGYLGLFRPFGFAGGGYVFISLP